MHVRLNDDLLDEVDSFSTRGRKWQRMEVV